MGYIGNKAGDLRVAFYLVPACYLALAGLIGYDGWRLAAKSSVRPLGEPIAFDRIPPTP